MADFGRRGGWWVAAQVVLFVLFVVALSNRRSVPEVVVFAGWIAAASGAALAIAGVMTLGPSLTPYPEPLAEAKLIERGVYHVVRHPIYGGLCIGALGLSLARGSLPALLTAVGILGFFSLKVRSEEARLVAAYPDYAAYRARVRAALIPWLY